jgi:uncharacterized protein DUF4199
MKKIVLTFGLIAGAIMSAMMIVTIPFHDRMGDSALVVGYATMVAAFLLVYFGIRSYRDQVGGGFVSFGRAFSVGLLIVILASAMYTATWEVLSNTVYPDFAQQYERAALEKARTQGKTDAEILALKADMDRFVANYRNPLYNIAMTFSEPLPVGLVVALVSAGLLRRKRRGTDTVLAVA